MDGSCVQNLTTVVEGGAGFSDNRATDHHSSSWLGVCVLHGQVLRTPCCFVPSDGSGSVLEAGEEL